MFFIVHSSFNNAIYQWKMAVAAFHLAGLRSIRNTTPTNHKEEASGTEFQTFSLLSTVRFHWNLSRFRIVRKPELLT